MFTWVPIYKELAEKMIKYEDRQGELLQILKDLGKQGNKVISLKDKDARGEETELKEIDPFTFFATFNRGITQQNRKAILSYLKDHFSLTSNVPEDFNGIPVVRPDKSWFFAFEKDRGKGDVKLLWNLAKMALEKETLSKDLFDDCLKIKQVGYPVLTVGLFWLAPNRFLPMDANTRDYLAAQGIPVKISNLESYQTLLTAVKEKIGHDFVQISNDAYIHGKKNELELIAEILKKDLSLSFDAWKKEIDAPMKPFFETLDKSITEATSKIGKFSVHTRSQEYDHRPRSCLTRAKWKLLGSKSPFEDKDFNIQVQLGDLFYENPHTISWGLRWWGSAKSAESANGYLSRIKHRVDYIKKASSGPGAPGTTIQVILKRYTPEEILKLDPKYDLKGEIVQDLCMLADELEKLVPSAQKPHLAHLATKLLHKKKQIILYGPPGTGKTFNTRAIATDICRGRKQDG